MKFDTNASSDVFKDVFPVYRGCMAWIIVGLGNPGEEYDRTRHNAGRMAVTHFAKVAGLTEWKAEKKALSHVSRGMIGKEIIVALLPDTFMNKSGTAVAPFVKSIKAAEKLIVAYDDLDLPLGSFKISFDRGSGGHKGLESVARTVRTTKFIRIRIGVSPTTAAGKTKKPLGEQAVLKFILEKFKPHEEDELKKVFKQTSAAIETTIREGRAIAMNRFN